MQARWNDRVIAESDRCIEIEGNQYFPSGDVDSQFLRPNSATTYCSWKGTASYYDVVVGDQVNEAAAWYYREPMEAAGAIENYIAFWRGVEVS